MADIFLSYSSKDYVFAKKAALFMESSGFTCYLAPDSMADGSSYVNEVPMAIAASRIFLLLISKNSMSSIWVEKELDHAISSRKIVIPLCLDKSELTNTFRFCLNNVSIILFEREYSSQLEKAKAQIQGYFPEKAAVQKAPEFPSSSEGKKVLPGTSGRRSSNSLRVNRIPLVCEKCGGRILINTKVGVYSCQGCGHDNLDDFQKIRTYLRKVGDAPADIIEEETGVSRQAIDYLFREEYLEIPESCDVRMSCERCGAPIRTGTLCSSCKISKPEIKPKESGAGKWHTWKI